MCLYTYGSADLYISQILLFAVLVYHALAAFGGDCCLDCLIYVIMGFR
jgi:hypothetical protein